MSENTTTPGPQAAGQGAAPGPGKGFHLGTREKTIFSIVVGLVAIGIGINSSVQYEMHNKTITTTHPPPTYTGSAPLPVTSIQQAKDSNNDFILVITPCQNETLNTSITATVVQAGDKIHSTDGIYVGVFTLPANSSLAYPTVFLRLMTRGDSSLYQLTLREDITLDTIYDAYLARKFLRE